MATAELTLDAEALYQAIDQHRRRLRMRRKEAAAELGVAGCTYTLWGNGTKPGSDAVLRACAWLDRNITDFAKTEEAPLTAESLAVTARPSARRAVNDHPRPSGSTRKGSYQ